MNRAEALVRWQRIANGDLRREQYDPVDLLAWIESVARQVLGADENTDSKQRPYDLTRAIGLYGRDDPYPELRNILEVWSCFDYLDDQGNPRKPSRGEMRNSLIAIARQVYPTWEQFSDDEVFRRANSLLK